MRGQELHTRESTSVMTPDRPMRPKLGRMPVAPTRSAGAIRLPSVSVPSCKQEDSSTSIHEGPYRSHHGSLAWKKQQAGLAQGHQDKSGRSLDMRSTLLPALETMVRQVMAGWAQDLTAKATAPATTAAAGPAEEPEEPSATFQGFFTLPPHQTSSKAISPVASFAISTAPAFCSLQMYRTLRGCRRVLAGGSLC